MLLPHFFLLQFGQGFLSFPLLSTLINSAAPVSLYSGERACGAKHPEEVVKMHEFDHIHSFLSRMQGNDAWALYQGFIVQAWVCGPGWGCLSEPPGSACRLRLVDTLRHALLGRWEAVSSLWGAWHHRLQDAGIWLLSAFYLILQEWCLWRWKKAD